MDLKDKAGVILYFSYWQRIQWKYQNPDVFVFLIQPPSVARSLKPINAYLIFKYIYTNRLFCQLLRVLDLFTLNKNRLKPSVVLDCYWSVWRSEEGVVKICCGTPVPQLAYAWC